MRKRSVRLEEDNKYTRFREELQALINSQSMENASGTPDFLLAQFLTSCLQAYDKAVADRMDWYGLRMPKGLDENLEVRY